jgi:hypothetical protein
LSKLGKPTEDLLSIFIITSFETSNYILNNLSIELGRNIDIIFVKLNAIISKGSLSKLTHLFNFNNVGKRLARSGPWPKSHFAKNDWYGKEL